MRIAPSGQDIRFDEKQIEEGRNFATKLWNAARFRQMHGPSSAERRDYKSIRFRSTAIEVLARLNETWRDVEELIANTSSTRLRSGSTIFSGATTAIGLSRRRRPTSSAMTMRRKKSRSLLWILSFPRSCVFSSVYAAYHGGTVGHCWVSANRRFNLPLRRRCLS